MYWVLRNREMGAQNPDGGQEEGHWEVGGSIAEKRRLGLILTGGWKAGLRTDRVAVDEVGHYEFREHCDHRC